MKQILILVTIILSLADVSQAEIWKCQKVGEQAASYTDTPTGGEGINCEKVETIRFTRSGDQAVKASGAARSYSPPPTHTTTQVKAKMKSASKPPAPKEEKKHGSAGGKSGGNHPSGAKSS